MRRARVLRSLPIGAGRPVPGGAGRRGGKLSVSALEGLWPEPDPALRRIGGRGTLLRAVLKAQAAEAAAPVRDHRHFAVDGSDAVGRDVRREPRQRPVALERASGLLFGLLHAEPQKPALLAAFWRPQGSAAVASFRGRRRNPAGRRAAASPEAAGRRLQEQTPHRARALARVRALLPGGKHAGRFPVHQSLFRQDAFARQEPSMDEA